MNAEVRSCNTSLVEAFEPVMIEIAENVTAELAVRVVKQLGQAYATGQHFVPMLIQSDGGDASAMFMIISAMETCPLPVYTVVQGWAASAGAIIFGCGERRFLGPYARLMVHDVSLSFPPDMRLKTEDLRSEAKDNEVINDMMYKLMAKRANQPLDFFSKYVRQHGSDCYFGAEKAKEVGLATDIGMPRFLFDVHVQSSVQILSDKRETAPPYVYRQIKSSGTEEKSEESSTTTEDKDEEEEDEKNTITMYSRKRKKHRCTRARK